MKLISPKIKVLIIALTAFIVIIVITKILLLLTLNGIESNWEIIKKDKYDNIQNTAENLFIEYEDRIKNFSAEFFANKKLISSINSQNIKKAYESINELEDISKYNIEVYNQRLELILFSGRQIHPEVSSLQKAISGNSFERIEHSGTMSYLVLYVPFSSGDSEKQQENVSVLVISRLLDIKYIINEELYSEPGISNTYKKNYGVNVSFFFRNKEFFTTGEQSNNNPDYQSFDLICRDKNIQCRIDVPVLNVNSYQREISERYEFVLSIIIFTASVLFIIIVFIISQNIKIALLKLFVKIFSLILLRYIILWINFPSKLFTVINIDIFSPVFFASDFGFGIAKSLGELMITSLFLVICTYLISLYFLNHVKHTFQHTNKNLSNLIPVIAGIIILLAINIYNYIIQSIVYNSNINFFERTSILTSDKPEFAVFIIVIITFTLMVLLLCSVFALRSILLLRQNFKLKKLFKRYSFFIYFTIIFIINYFTLIFNISLFDTGPGFVNSSLIILLLAVFTYILFRKILILPSVRIISFPVISILILMSLVISPLMLINEITSQESKYLEQETKRLATSSGEELPFLIITVLDDIIEKDFIVSNWKDKNMIPKLAFNLWSSSRLYSENLNSSIILLDTNYRIISDFSISPLNINSDSVTNYIIKNKAIFIRGGEDTLQFEEDEDAESNMIAEGVIQNSDLKFYAGLRPVYFQPGGNPDFKELLGYLIAAIQYDTKSYYSAKHFEFFKGTKPDRLTNKLTSQPIYSEFSDGEMAGTSNYDVSKSLIKTLDMLRSSLEGKIDKSTLRFDQIENNLYKTYFVIVEPVKNQPEKIYAVSIKVNDINGFVFFFLKCLLVSTLIYLIFLILYTIYITIKHFIKSRRLLLFAFGFREKLFVSFFVVSVIPVLILALYSREYVESKNNKTAVNEIISDLKLVEQYIKSKLDWTDIKLRNKGVDDKLILQSNIFGKSFAESDKIFNFFVKNKLTSTTNEELYKSDLLETRISGNAYYNLVLLKRDFFIENQEIGVFRFVSGYKPVYDRYFNLIGIVSTLTLFRQYEIDTEITESLVYIFGTYLIAIVFLIVVVNILASRISNPIIKLMQATEDLSRGKTDIQLPVTTRDEIGELVKSFNRMTIELKRSREELKKAERESAWRDIARQVAHEIKNPLTPMKLAIQHLYYAYIHSSKDFKTIIHNTNKLIIDQIETLNRIATEFSDFAKLPRRNYVPINMNEIIKDTVKLLKSQSNIIIDIGKSAINTLILGDKDELKRVLINIIRNSTQAIEQKTYFEGEGRILISTYSKGQTYFLKIQDNGIGMDEQTQQKLFEPYFSTKSTGMGLGLVITKKILDDMGSKITLNSKLNEGTEVLISFPIKKL